MSNAELVKRLRDAQQVIAANLDDRLMERINGDIGEAIAALSAQDDVRDRARSTIRLLSVALHRAAHYMRNCGVDLDQDYPEILSGLEYADDTSKPAAPVVECDQIRRKQAIERDASRRQYMMQDTPPAQEAPQPLVKWYKNEFDYHFDDPVSYRILGIVLGKIDELRELDRRMGGKDV